MNYSVIFCQYTDISGIAWVLILIFKSLSWVCGSYHVSFRVRQVTILSRKACESQISLKQWQNNHTTIQYANYQDSSHEGSKKGTGKIHDQVLTESCLHKGHGWFLPRKVHESTRYDVSRRRHFQMKEKISKHMILAVNKCHLDPAKPGPWATLSHSTVFDNWCFLENCNPNIQWFKILSIVFSTQICHNVS